MKTRLLSGLLGAASLAAARPALAQKIEGAVGVQRLNYALDDNGVSGTQTGSLLGGWFALGVGRFTLGLGGSTGTLAASTDGSLPSRSLRMTTISAGIRASSWLTIGAQAVARRDAADTVIVLQRLGGPFVRGNVDLGGTGLQGLFDAAVYPVNSVSGADPASTALRAGVGVRFMPATSPVMVQLSYRLFRIDHKAVTTAAPRLEQDQGLVLEFGLHK